MKKHLATHFYGGTMARRDTPVYQCSACSFRSDWQYAVKRHIITSHLGSSSSGGGGQHQAPASCVRINCQPASPTKTIIAAQDELEMKQYQRDLLRRMRLRRRLTRLQLKRATNVIVCSPALVAVNDNQPAIKLPLSQQSNSLQNNNHHQNSRLHHALNSVGSSSVSSSTVGSSSTSIASTGGAKLAHSAPKHEPHHCNDEEDEDEFLDDMLDDDDDDDDDDNDENRPQHFDDEDEFSGDQSLSMSQQAAAANRLG